MIELLNQCDQLFILRLKERNSTAATTSHDLLEALINTFKSFSNNDLTSTASSTSSENYAQNASNFNQHQDRKSWESLAKICKRY